MIAERSRVSEHQELQALREVLAEAENRPPAVPHEFPIPPGGYGFAPPPRPSMVARVAALARAARRARMTRQRATWICSLAAGVAVFTVTLTSDRAGSQAFRIPSDPAARYRILDISEIEGGAIETQTIRQLDAEASYAAHRIDCRTLESRTLAAGGRPTDLRARDAQSANGDEDALSPTIRNSASWWITQRACEKAGRL